MKEIEEVFEKGEVQVGEAKKHIQNDPPKKLNSQRQEERSVRKESK